MIQFDDCKLELALTFKKAVAVLTLGMILQVGGDQ